MNANLNDQIKHAAKGSKKPPALLTARNILFVLSASTLPYVLFVSLLCLFLKRFDDTLGTWQSTCAAMDSNPIATIILVIASYLVFLLITCYMAIKRMRRV